MLQVAVWEKRDHKTEINFYSLVEPRAKVNNHVNHNYDDVVNIRSKILVPINIMQGTDIAIPELRPFYVGACT